jgi:hypothetical protein
VTVVGNTDAGAKLSGGNTMRAICWSVLSLGLLIQNPGAEGQDTPRPALPGVQTKKPEPKAIQIQVDGLQSQFAPQQSGGLDGTIDRLIKDLEDLRREMKKTKEGTKVQVGPKGDFKPGSPPGRPGGPGPMPGQPGFPPGASHVDQKLDMILMQMDEMRRDIKDLQNRLPAAKEKKGPPFEFKGFFGPKGPMPKEKKPGAAPETNDSKAKPDVAVQKALEYLKDRQRETAERERQKAIENAKLRDQIELLMREVQMLREKIDKTIPRK